MLASNYKNIAFLFFKWAFICLFTGLLVGISSALFLFSLDWVTAYRESNNKIVYFLPIAGLLIGLTYHYFGKNVEGGNNLLIQKFHQPKKQFHFVIAPLVYLATILTHLFGGSAGREGTAVQIGGAIAEQANKLFKLNNLEKKIIVIIGISAGFSAVFGTPYAGAFFAIEVLMISGISIHILLASIAVALISHYTCLAMGIKHAEYFVNTTPSNSFGTFYWVVLVGIVFGIVAAIFSKTLSFWSTLFKSHVSYPPFRPFIGGLILLLTIYFFDVREYLGLGLPTITNSFSINLNYFDFILKLLLTTFTLGCGFKGGEVTPLFFVGATLGNALVWIVPLPIDLLAALGFLAVFAAATNSPIASTIMGFELFGVDCVIYFFIANYIAYFISGNSVIYKSQTSFSSSKNYFYP